MSDEQNVQQDSVLLKTLDHQRWLMNHGFINDMHKDQLYIFGALVHKEVQAVELDMDVDKKIISYRLYTIASLKRKMSKFKKLSKETGIWGMWKFKRLYEKEGNLDFSAIISRFVADYCGPKWEAQVQVVDIKEYEDGYREQQASEQDDKQPDS